jgi:hypothetical protein
MATTHYPYLDFLPEFYDCELCGESTDADEWVCNFGICDVCFDEDYELFMQAEAEKYGGDGYFD